MVWKKFVLLRFFVAALGSISFTSVPPALAQSQPGGQPPTTVLGVECSRVFELGIDKQTNMRAGMIMVDRARLPVSG